MASSSPSEVVGYYDVSTLQKVSIYKNAGGQFLHSLTFNGVEFAWRNPETKNGWLKSTDHLLAIELFSIPQRCLLKTYSTQSQSRGSKPLSENFGPLH